MSFQTHQNFMILTLGAVLGNPTFSTHIVSFRVPEEGRAATLKMPRDRRVMMSVRGNFFENPPTL